MSTAVYVLCALTSLACAALLLRAYRANPTRLLFWSFICFALLAVNNVFLVVDLSVRQDVDLSAIRTATGFAGLAALLFGLIWDTR